MKTIEKQGMVGITGIGTGLAGAYGAHLLENHYEITSDPVLDIALRVLTGVIVAISGMYGARFVINTAYPPVGSR